MSIFDIILLQIRISAFLGLAPFKITAAKGRPCKKDRSLKEVAVLGENENRARAWYIWRIVIIVFAITLPLRTLYRATMGKSKGNNVASFLLLTVWSTIGLGTYWAQSNMVHRKEEIALLINSAIGFQLKSKLELKHGITNSVVLSLVIGVTLSPVVLPLLAWVTPCAPQYLGNVFIDCSDHSKLDLASRLLIYLIEVVLITAGAMSTGILSNSIIALAGLLNTFTQLARDKAEKLNTTNVKEQALLYRQLQILMKLFNESFQMFHMANIQTSCSVVIIGSLFGTIELHELVPIPGYLAFPFFTINCVLILFGTIHLCSCVTLTSIKVKLQWTKNRYFGDKWFKRFAKSCPKLLIRIGPFHVVDRARLAIVYRFCLQRTFFFIVYARK